MTAPLLISLPSPQKFTNAHKKTFVLAAASAAVGTAPPGRYRHEVVMSLPAHIVAALAAVVARTDWSTGVYKMMFDRLYSCRLATVPPAV
jgi:hypothetical protein